MLQKKVTGYIIFPVFPRQLILRVCFPEFSDQVQEVSLQLQKFRRKEIPDGFSEAQYHHYFQTSGIKC